MCGFPILKGKVAIIWQDSPVFQAPDMYPKKTSEVSIAASIVFPFRHLQPRVVSGCRKDPASMGSRWFLLVKAGHGWLSFGVVAPPTQDASHHLDDINST